MNSCQAPNSIYCYYDKTQTDFSSYQTRQIKSPTNLSIHSGHFNSNHKTFDDRLVILTPDEQNKENPFVFSPMSTIGQEEKPSLAPLNARGSEFSLLNINQNSKVLNSNSKLQIEMVQKHKINDSIINNHHYASTNPQQSKANGVSTGSKSSSKAQGKNRMHAQFSNNHHSQSLFVSQPNNQSHRNQNLNQSQLQGRQSTQVYGNFADGTGHQSVRELGVYGLKNQKNFRSYQSNQSLERPTILEQVPHTIQSIKNQVRQEQQYQIIPSSQAQLNTLLQDKKHSEILQISSSSLSHTKATIKDNSKHDLLKSKQTSSQARGFSKDIAANSSTNLKGLSFTNAHSRKPSKLDPNSQSSIIVLHQHSSKAQHDKLSTQSQLQSFRNQYNNSVDKLFLNEPHPLGLSSQQQKLLKQIGQDKTGSATTYRNKQKKSFREDYSSMINELQSQQKRLQEVQSNGQRLRESKSIDLMEKQFQSFWGKTASKGEKSSHQKNVNKTLQKWNGNSKEMKRMQDDSIDRFEAFVASVRNKKFSKANELTDNKNFTQSKAEQADSGQYLTTTEDLKAGQMQMSSSKALDFISSQSKYLTKNLMHKTKPYLSQMNIDRTYFPSHQTQLGKSSLSDNKLFRNDKNQKLKQKRDDHHHFAHQTEETVNERPQKLFIKKLDQVKGFNAQASLDNINFINVSLVAKQRNQLAAVAQKQFTSYSIDHSYNNSLNNSLEKVPTKPNCLIPSGTLLSSDTKHFMGNKTSITKLPQFNPYISIDEERSIDTTVKLQFKNDSTYDHPFPQYQKKNSLQFENQSISKHQSQLEKVQRSEGRIKAQKEEEGQQQQYRNHKVSKKDWARKKIETNKKQLMGKRQASKESLNSEWLSSSAKRSLNQFMTMDQRQSQPQKLNSRSPSQETLLNIKLNKIPSQALINHQSEISQNYQLISSKRSQKNLKTFKQVEQMTASQTKQEDKIFSLDLNSNPYRGNSSLRSSVKVYQPVSHSRQSSYSKHLQLSGKGKIFFNRFQGRGNDSIQDQEVQDLDSSVQIHELILEEESIPSQNRDSVLTSIKTAEQRVNYHTSFDEYDPLQFSNCDELQLAAESKVQGINLHSQSLKTLKKSIAVASRNYGENENPNSKHGKRISSETTVQNFQSLETKLKAVRKVSNDYAACNILSIQQLQAQRKKQKVVQDKLKQQYGHKLDRLQRQISDGKEVTVAEDKPSSQKVSIQAQIRLIRDFEMALQHFSSCQKYKNSLSFHDLAHSLNLMKFLVAYPRNYSGVKFNDGKQLTLFLREKEVAIQLWNLLKPHPQSGESKKEFKYCVLSKSISFLLSLAVEELSDSDYEQIYQNYLNVISFSTSDLLKQSVIRIEQPSDVNSREAGNVRKKTGEQSLESGLNNSQGVTSKGYQRNSLEGENDVEPIEIISFEKQPSSSSQSSANSQIPYIGRFEDEDSYKASKYYLEPEMRWSLKDTIDKLKQLRSENFKYTKLIDSQSLGSVKLMEKINNVELLRCSKIAPPSADELISSEQTSNNEESGVQPISSVATQRPFRMVRLESFNSVEDVKLREILIQRFKLTPVNKWELNFLGQK